MRALPQGVVNSGFEPFVEQAARLGNLLAISDTTHCRAFTLCFTQMDTANASFFLSFFFVFT
jgi:hypothetical protein